MNKAQRETLQKTVRSAKEQAARVDEIADRGGNRTWPVKDARADARASSEWADEQVKKLARRR
ncbi:hypothetical protein AB0K40_17615 [Nonomuraea bangladeshensis]|uniref:Antitoxin n=1 Tax=Nonomuraea bangladeshensis TaxID=404385 RepID=A0ABV3H471_9ACTN